MKKFVVPPSGDCMINESSCLKAELQTFLTNASASRLICFANQKPLSMPITNQRSRLGEQAFEFKL